MTDCIIAFVAGTFVGGIVGFMALCIVSAGGDDADLRRELELNEPLFETLNAANDALLAENAELRRLLREILNNCCEGIESTCDMCGCYRKSDGACMADVIAERLGVDV